jgi:hypothetical protein
MTSPTIPNRPSGFASSCVRHQFDHAVDRCRTCDEPFCAECLLYAFGDNQPPFCMSCALAASGVRVRGAKAPRVSRREIRRREKEAKAAAALQALPPPPTQVEWSVPEPPVAVENSSVSGEPRSTWLHHGEAERRESSIETF